MGFLVGVSSRAMRPRYGGGETAVRGWARNRFPSVAEPGIVCPDCDRLVSLEEAVDRRENEVWFACPRCDFRERLVPRKHSRH